MNQAEFNEVVMKPLEVQYRKIKELRKEAYDQYYEKLCSFDINILEQATDKIIREGSKNGYFPKTNEIINAAISYLPVKSSETIHGHKPEINIEGLVLSYLTSPAGQDLLKDGLARYAKWHIEETKSIPNEYDIDDFARDNEFSKRRGKTLGETGRLITKNGENELEITKEILAKSVSFLRCEFDIESNLKSKYLN